ncbi:MAG: hypothetical protein JST39_02760, partial [Bacteroidetes bacterium]|nr:hypothetical protein [Bacteroidota bacterium]
MFSPIYFGNTGGPWNCSALITTVSSANEWEQGEFSVHNDQNYYYFGTILQTPNGTNKRAPLRISGRELQWLTGNTEAEAARLNESGRMLIGTSADNGHKLQVNGSTFSNYFTNVSTALGSGEDGALRLRWGGPGGFYIDFYNQGNAGKRGFIGSASDARPLQIHDSIGVSLSTTPYLALGTEPSIGGARFSVCNPENSGVSTVNFARVVNGLMNYDFAIVPSGNIVIGGGTDYGNRFQVNGSAYISGNTGVGTAFPTAQLHTTGSVRFAGLTVDSSLSRVLVSDAFGNISYRNLSSWAAVSTFRNGLTVNGTLSAQKIRLQPGAWADYVFDKSYRLTPLQETEAYINRYHHLPGLPSATEVESKGVDLAETQTALLAKIEELTLHLIQEEKDKQALREDVERLKKQNDELRALRNEVEELKRMMRK